MADHPSGKESLRAVVISCFSAILSGNQHQMKDAEESLKALQVTEGEDIAMKLIQPLSIISLELYPCPRETVVKTSITLLWY